MYVNSQQKETQSQMRMFNAFFALAMFLIPFNGIQSFSAIGEFQGEAAFFIFLPLVALSIPKLELSQSVVRFMVIMMALAIGVSLLWNVNDMAEATLRGRSGFNKFITSSITVVFMMAFALMVEQRLRQPGMLLNQIFRPTVWVTVFLLLMAVFQMSTWYSGGAMTAYNVMLSVLRPRYEEQVQMGRLDTVSFEPSVFSLFLTFSLVLMFGLSPLLEGKMRAFVKFVLIPASIAVIFISNARTGMISFVFVLFFQIFYMVVLRFKKPNILATFGPAIVFLTIHTLVFVYDQKLLSSILGDVSISNLSRFAAIITGFEMYQRNPLFGVGLGQYAFNAQFMMPYWAWFSPEVTGQFLNPYPSWPPNHSLPMRMASELGSLGIFAYYGMICIFFKLLADKIWAEKERIGSYPYIGHTLLLSQVFILFSGIAFDSFRQFTVWILIATVAAYIRYDKPESLLSGKNHDLISKS